MTTKAVGGRTSVAPVRTFSRGRRGIVKQVVLYALAIGASILFMLPFLWTIGTSLKPLNELYTFPPTFVPENPRFANFRDVFTIAPFARFLATRVKC